MAARSFSDPTVRANGERIDGGVAAGRIQLALGIVAIILAMMLVALGELNRSSQARVAAGQARIAGAQAANNVNNTLIRLLARSAAEDGDPQLRALLARNGITFAPAAPAAAPGGAGQ